MPVPNLAMLEFKHQTISSPDPKQPSAHEQQLIAQLTA
jgi:hypothetical protein